MMYGADHERLLAGAAEMRRAADELERSQSLVHRVLIGAAWLGQVALNFTSMWNGQHRRSLMTTSAFIREAAATLEREAIQQRDASAAGTGLPAWLTRLPNPFIGGVGLEPQDPEMRPTGLAQFFNRQERLEQDEFEILRVSENPPRYIVNLPGVEIGAWDQDHLRDFDGAVDARVHGRDAYADRVKQEMRRAGVPAGAEVMLVGHSYGAIAAMNIARDDSFNRVGDTDGSDGYSVQITHVLAAGAGIQDWIDDPPPGTQVLMAINRNDIVASAIQAGDLDPTALAEAARPVESTARLYSRVTNDVTDNLDYRMTSHGPGRTVMEFDAQEDASGHHYDNYGRALNGMGNSDFVDSAAKMYFGGGGGMQSVQVKVPDET